MTKIYEKPIIDGNIEELDRLFLKEYPLTEDVFDYALWEPNIEVVKWLYEHKCPYHCLIGDDFMEYGEFEIVEYLFEKGIFLSDMIYSKLIFNHNKYGDKNKSLKTIKWVLDKKKPTLNDANFALANNKLDVYDLIKKEMYIDKNYSMPSYSLSKQI